MNLSLRSIVFHTDDPSSVAEFLAYVLDLELEAKNCDQYELHNSLWNQFPEYICFRKTTEKVINNNLEFVIGIRNKNDWDDQFKKIVFYLHQNGLSEKFSPSKEIRKPGGIGFHVSLLPGVKLEFFHPFDVHKNDNPASRVRTDLLNDRKILIN